MGNKRNKVFLIGAGAGGLDLLTLKAYEILKNQAEIVVYDRLISQDIIDIINPAAEKIFAGKEPDFHHKTQDEINSILVEKFKLGKCVVRLKGGDPFIFGRGGEEIEALREHDIEVEIVTGVSAAQAVAAKYQIPLTYRRVSDGVIYISGHNYKDEIPNLDYEYLAKTNNTIVVYMGVKNADTITQNLIKFGKKVETEVAVIQNFGNAVEEKFLKTTLAKLSLDIEKNSIKSPAIIIIGEVVKKSL